MNIIYKSGDYINEKTVKKQIVLHAGREDEMGLGFYKHKPHYYIQKNGEIINYYDDQYWGNHLDFLNSDLEYFGIFKEYDVEKTSISILLESLGVAYFDHNRKIFISLNLGIEVPRVYEFCSNAKFKGHQYYDFITTKQIESLRELLVELTKKHHIPTKYNPDMWSLSRKALTGTPGIWTHNSYRTPSIDPHPQIELVNLLRSL